MHSFAAVRGLLGLPEAGALDASLGHAIVAR
jgi:hypothetical protein